MPQEASLKRCTELSPSRSKRADHRQTPPSRSQLDRTGTTNLPPPEAWGRGAERRRQEPRFYSSRNFWDSITQLRHQVPTTGHLSARRWAQGLTLDLQGVGEDDGSLPLSSSSVFLNATCCGFLSKGGARAASPSPVLPAGSHRKSGDASDLSQLAGQPARRRGGFPRSPRLRRSGPEGPPSPGGAGLRLPSRPSVLQSQVARPRHLP